MERRKFIRKSCLACMGLASGSLLLEGCASALPVIKTTARGQFLSIALSQFTGNNRLLVVRCNSLENDILLIRNGNLFRALYMKCTHEGVGLTATESKIVCAAHGSSFDFEGRVLKEPALRPLREFSTQVVKEDIIIQLN